MILLALAQSRWELLPPNIVEGAHLVVMAARCFRGMCDNNQLDNGVATPPTASQAGAIWLDQPTLVRKRREDVVLERCAFVC